MRAGIGLVGAVLAGAVLAGATPAFAQAVDPISTDRPGLGFSPGTVAPGVWQVEAGLPAVAAGGGTALVSLPLLARLGLAGDLEARLGTVVYDGGPDEAFPSVEGGLKWAPAPDAQPAALILSVVVPTQGGRSSLSGYGVTAWTLGRASLTAVAGVTTDSDFEAVTGTGVLVLARSLAEAVGGYVEGAVFPRSGTTDAYVGAGLTLLATPDVQLDVSFDRRVAGGARPWLFGAGVSLRRR